MRCAGRRVAPTRCARVPTSAPTAASTRAAATRGRAQPGGEAVDGASPPPAACLVAQPSLCPRVCHVQDGKTPLHLAAESSSSVVAVQALLAAYPEAVEATDKVRRQRHHQWRDGGAGARLLRHRPVRRPPVVRFAADDLHAPPLSLSACPLRRTAARRPTKPSTMTTNLSSPSLRAARCALFACGGGADAWPRPHAPRPHSPSATLHASPRIGRTRPDEWGLVARAHHRRRCCDPTHPNPRLP